MAKRKSLTEMTLQELFRLDSGFTSTPCTPKLHRKIVKEVRRRNERNDEMQWTRMQVQTHEALELRMATPETCRYCKWFKCWQKETLDAGFSASGQCYHMPKAVSTNSSAFCSKFQRPGPTLEQIREILDTPNPITNRR